MSIWLVMQSTDGVERQFAVKKSNFVIGRETNCDVRIPVPAVSRQHCRLTVDDGQLRLTDLDSQLGTFHNGNRVKEACLAAEDKLTVGPVTFIIRVDDDAILPHEPATQITIIRQDNGHVKPNFDG